MGAHRLHFHPLLLKPELPLRNPHHHVHPKSHFPQPQKLHLHQVLGCLPRAQKVVGEHLPPTAVPPTSLYIPPIGPPIETKHSVRLFGSSHFKLLQCYFMFKVSNLGTHIYIYIYMYIYTCIYIYILIDR